MTRAVRRARRRMFGWAALASAALILAGWAASDAGLAAAGGLALFALIARR